MPGQRRDGGVIKAKCIGRPPHRPYRQRHPGRRLLVSLTERVGRTRKFLAAPDPHQPSQQGHPAEAGHIVQYSGAATVAHREYPARRAGRLQPTRLDRQHQPLLTIDLHLKDVHVGNIEDRISSGAPARTRATHRVRHRRVLRTSVAWSLLILKGPTPLLLDQHAGYRAQQHPCSDPKRFPNACQPVLYGLRVDRCGHGGRTVPPLHDDGSAFVEVNVVRPATFICDVRRAGAPR